MGSFIGHAIPGTFFFIYGFWWATQVMRKYFLSRQTKVRFRTTIAFPLIFCPVQRIREAPIEPIVKIVLCVCGIIVEFYGGINHVTHRFDSIGNMQHITMYFFFALTGVMELLTMKRLAPENSDYVSFILALLVEGALFKFHLYGRTELDILLHVLLLYVIGFSALVMALEAFCRHTAVLPMLRAMLTMLQGTWFWTVGIILYNPLPGAIPWEQDSHSSFMFAVACFSWQLAAILLLMMVVGVVTACCLRNKLHYARLHSDLAMKSLKEREAGDKDGDKLHIQPDDDNSDDLEFQAPVSR